MSIVREASSTRFGWLMPPNDEEKYAYLKAPQHRWFFVLSALAMAGVAASFVGLATQTYWTLIFFVPLILLIAEQLLSLRTSTYPRRIALVDHLATIELWQPETYPSVDIFLPSAGEDLHVLENTAHHVQALQWPGRLKVYMLDDAGRPEVEELARQFGFEYMARPGSAFKKAGNLQYAYERTDGDHIVILDADFVPRPDFLAELVPYMDDETVGIVQSPQHFYSNREMSWLERCAGATQELFYRHIQPSRDAVGAAICVGTSAVYRRKALEAIGGFPQIGHSEDVYTGVFMGREGYRLQYVPTLVSRGQCPTDIDSFIAQQYRWCEGSMSLAMDDDFHYEESMTFAQRASFWSGFLYYMTTAMLAILAPLPILVMVAFFPQYIKATHMLPLLGAVLLWTIVLPVMSQARWWVDVLRVQVIYGFAHLFCIMDLMRGQVSEWVATGSTSTRAPIAQRVRSFMVPYIIVTQIGIFVGLAIGTMNYGIGNYWANIALAVMGAYVFVPVALEAGVRKSLRIPSLPDIRPRLVPAEKMLASSEENA